MSQKHYRQHGTFHITTNAKKGIPWCTIPGIPEILIDNLVMTRNLQQAEIYAFCILSNHMHFVIQPGEKGLSAFMHSFKRNSSKDIRYWIENSSGNRTRAAAKHICRSRGSDTPANQEVFTGWQNGFHDERIRSSKQRTDAIRYVENNAFRHAITEEVDTWPWSSVHYRHLLDETDLWFDSPYDPH